MWDIIKTGLILTFYSLIAGALLAFVYIKTAPIIESNKQAAAGESVMAEVLPGISGGFEQQGAGSEFPYWIGYSDANVKKPGGYVFIVSGKGYSSTIDAMVGVDSDLKVTGVKILSQQETPGLGDKITEIRPGESDPWFTRQFISKSASDDLRVKKDGGIIDALSGATISSRAVSGSVNIGLKQLEAILKNESFTPPEEPAPGEEEETPHVMPTDDILVEVMPGMAGGYELKDERSDFPYWIAYRDAGKSTTGGYLFVAREEGFASTIQTLVGVSADGKITSIKILFQEETEGYGTRVEEILKGEKDPWFPRQFIGKSASDDIALKQDSGTIDGITDATISSRAFTTSINTGLKRLKAVLSGETYIPIAEPAKSSPDKEETEIEVEEQSIRISPEKALTAVLPNMAGGYVLKDEESEFPYWIGYRDKEKSQVGGYLFVAFGEGFGSTIETLIGADPSGKIVGIKILYQEETLEYGDKIVEIIEGEKDPWFPRQFIGKSTSDTIALKQDGGVIDGITDATISAKAVTESIDTGLRKLMEVLGK